MNYLGVDCGTSAVKAVVVDGSERVIAASERAYRPDHPHPLWSEQDPEVWREASFAAIRDLGARAGEAMARLRGIGFSGQMHSAVLLGRDDRPVRPAILHNDTRAHL
jgi:xylulokinase